ncbi:MAG: twin-arginine translocase subunit TatC [Chitinophagales bacterium]|nr:twin-arginine translocase subunit TatC [Chitinophagales bacterium]
MGWLNTLIKKRSSDQAEMSFIDHLEELRWVILRSLIAIVVAGIFIFLNTKFIFDHIIFAPKNPDFWTFRVMCKLGSWVHMSSLCVQNFNVPVQNIDFSGQFMVSLQNAFTLGLVIVFPFVLWELWKFISPALYEQERQKIYGIVLSGSLLFYLGVVFGYFLIVPFTVFFLGTYQVSTEVKNTISLSSYIETVTGLSFACGLVFEFPLIIYLLAVIGVATHEILSGYRKYAVVFILLLSAVITPSPDMVSQTLVALPLYGLFEIGILISKKITNSRMARRLEAEKRSKENSG